MGEMGPLIGFGPGLGLTPQSGHQDCYGDQPGDGFHHSSSKRLSKAQFLTVRIPSMSQAVKAWTIDSPLAANRATPRLSLRVG